MIRINDIYKLLLHLTIIIAISCILVYVASINMNQSQETDIDQSGVMLDQNQEVLGNEQIESTSLDVDQNQTEITENNEIVENDKDATIELAYSLIQVNELYEKGIKSNDSTSTEQLIEAMVMCEEIKKSNKSVSYGVDKVLMNAYYALYERTLNSVYLLNANDLAYDAMSRARMVSIDAFNQCVYMYAQTQLELTKLNESEASLEVYEECLSYFEQIKGYKPMIVQSYIITIYRRMYLISSDIKYLERLISDTNLELLEGQYYYNAKKDISDSEYLIALKALENNDLILAKNHLNNAKYHILEIPNYNKDEYLLTQLVNIEYYSKEE